MGNSTEGILYIEVTWRCGKDSTVCLEGVEHARVAAGRQVVREELYEAKVEERLGAVRAGRGLPPWAEADERYRRGVKAVRLRL